MSNLLLSISVGGIVALSVVGVIIVAAIVIILCLVPLRLWFRALMSSAHIPMTKLIGMKMRKVNVTNIVLNYITAKKAGLNITLEELETHSMAGGDIERVVKVGDEIEIGDPLVVFGLGNTGDKAVDNFLKAFGDDNALEGVKRSVRSVHAGRVVDVRMYTNKSMDKLSPSLFEIFDEYFKTNIKKRKVLDKHDKTNSVYKLDTLYSLPTEPLKTPSIKGINCDVMIEVYIEHEDEASVGDKLVVYGASKQVLSEVVPQGLEPYAESTPNEEISMFVAPSSILKRMIPSLTITASGNKVLLELKRQMRNIWESN